MELNAAHPMSEYAIIIVDTWIVNNGVCSIGCESLPVNADMRDMTRISMQTDIRNVLYVMRYWNFASVLLNPLFLSKNSIMNEIIVIRYPEKHIGFPKGSYDTSSVTPLSDIPLIHKV